MQLRGGVTFPLSLSTAPPEALTIGIRASAFRITPRLGDVAVLGKVELAEISGSDTFVHAQTSIGGIVAQLTGVHVFSLGEPVTLYVDPAQAYAFDARGDLIAAPPAVTGTSVH